MEEYKVNDNLINILNQEGACKVTAMQKYAVQNNVPILRPVTASLLKSFVRSAKPKTILEIGTAIGYSGTLMLENSDATLHTIEKMPENVVLASKNFEKLGFEERVKIFEGDAKEILPTLKSKYDFIFLDGPKGQYTRYLNDLIRLLNTSGILFADNVLYRNMVFSGQFIPRKKRAIVNNLEDFLNKISTHENLKSQILNIEDGVSISIKEK